MRFLVSALAFSAITQAAPTANNPTDNSALYGELVTAPTVIQRFQKLLTNAGKELLTGDDLIKATIFDFNKDAQPFAGTQGGLTSVNDVHNFPILINSGISFSVASLGPCGIFLPHVHPRANEFFTVVDGAMTFGYMVERGLLGDTTPSPFVTGNLTKYEGTLFPQGSIHYQINEGCSSATAAIALSSEDPGTTPVLMTPKGNSTVTKRRVGGRVAVEARDAVDVRGLVAPEIAALLDKCFVKCNLKKA